MCPGCARPQFPAAACVACGAALPEAAAVEAASGQAEPSARDRILQAFEPHLEASLGGGRTLLLSERRLEWKPAKDDPGHQVELGSLESVGLGVRPIWEALLLIPL